MFASNIVNNSRIFYSVYRDFNNRNRLPIQNNMSLLNATEPARNKYIQQ